jgi:hypothetical protein
MIFLFLSIFLILMGDLNSRKINLTKTLSANENILTVNFYDQKYIATSVTETITIKDYYFSKTTKKNIKKEIFLFLFFYLIILKNKRGLLNIKNPDIPKKLFLNIINNYFL